MKNILYISTFPPIRCGVAHYMQYLTSELARLGGLNFKVLANYPEGTETNRPPYVFSVWKKNNLASLRTLFKKIRQTKSDIIHLQFHPGLYGRLWFSLILATAVLLFKPSQAKLFVTFHTIPIPSQLEGLRRILKGWVIKFLLWKIDRAVVHTQKMGEVLKEEFNFPSHKIVIMPMGCRSLKAIPQIKAKKRLGMEDKRILFSPVLLRGGTKMESLIEAVANLQRQQPDIILAAVGLSPMHWEKNNSGALLENLARKKGLKYFILLKNQKIFERDLPLWLSAADILYFLSDNYPSADCSLAIYNSLPYKKIIMVSDVPKFSEIVKFLRKVGGGKLIIEEGSTNKENVRNIQRAIGYALNKKLRTKILLPLSRFISEVSWLKSALILKEAYEKTITQNKAE